jgi:hypothetical protein
LQKTNAALILFFAETLNVRPLYSIGIIECLFFHVSYNIGTCTINMTRNKRYNRKKVQIKFSYGNKPTLSNLACSQAGLGF